MSGTPCNISPSSAPGSRAAQAAELPARPGPVAGLLADRTGADQALARRSVRRFDRSLLARSALHAVLDGTRALLETWPHLGVPVVIAEKTTDIPDLHECAVTMAGLVE
jgi:hypothetical protein